MTLSDVYIGQIMWLYVRGMYEHMIGMVDVAQWTCILEHEIDFSNVRLSDECVVKSRSDLKGELIHNKQNSSATQCT